MISNDMFHFHKERLRKGGARGRERESESGVSVSIVGMQWRPLLVLGPMTEEPSASAAQGL